MLGSQVILTSGLGLLASVSLGGQFLPVGHLGQNTSTYIIPPDFPVGLALLQSTYTNGMIINEMLNVVVPAPVEEGIPDEE